VDVDHTLLANRFEEEINSFVKSGLEKQLANPNLML
jgi:hypothetical protein